MTDRTVLRSRLNVAFFGATAALFGMFTVAGIGIMIFGGDGPLYVWAVFTLLSAAGAAWFARCAALRVVVYDDYIRIVNPLRSYLIGWHEIDKIDTARDPAWVVRIWTRGTPIRAYGLSRLGGVGLPTDILAGDTTPTWLTGQHAALDRRWPRH